MSAVPDTSLAADAAPAPFAEALARAEHDKERVVLTRQGRPVAALVPIEDMDALEAMEDERDSRLAAEAVARWEAGGRQPGIPLAEIARELGMT
jgi:prevent-host-death family protein